MTLLTIPIGIYVAAVLAPALAFLLLILAYSKKRMKAKVISINVPLKVVGFSTKTTEETFIEDDACLWKRYKQERDSIPNRKEEFSFLSIREKAAPGASWNYYIGTIVNDFDHVPSDMIKVEVPVGLYAAVHIPIKSSKKWALSLDKAETFIFEKWLPKSGYEINYDSDVYEMEYHDKRNVQKTRSIIFYVAIKPKK